jgi:hypothetical protein
VGHKGDEDNTICVVNDQLVYMVFEHDMAVHGLDVGGSSILHSLRRRGVS